MRSDTPKNNSILSVDLIRFSLVAVRNPTPLGKWTFSIIYYQHSVLCDFANFHPFVKKNKNLFSIISYLSPSVPISYWNIHICFSFCQRSNSISYWATKFRRKFFFVYTKNRTCYRFWHRFDVLMQNALMT